MQVHSVFFFVKHHSPYSHAYSIILSSFVPFRDLVVAVVGDGLENLALKSLWINL